MKYEIYEKNINDLNTECLILFTKETNEIKFNYDLIPHDIKIYMQNILNDSYFSGKYKESLFSYIPVKDSKIKSLILIGMGSLDKLDKSRFTNLLKILIGYLKKNKFNKISININDLLHLIKNEKNIKHQTYIYEEVINHIEYNFYNFSEYKSKKNNENDIKELSFISNIKIDNNNLIDSIKKSKIISSGISFARDLGNQPPNICNPEYLEKISKSLSNKYENLNIEILEKSDMESLNMGAFLAVAEGSPQAPKMIILKHQNQKSKNKKPIVLVGKGITFDTGGNSLKPSNSMVGMKYDMCGAAAVLGITKIISELNLPLYFIGVLACAENTPGGNAARPDDIVNTHAGISVEILNTDAEGRLVLCDTLSYIKKYNPEEVIDIATLTGACVVALGREYSGLFSNNDILAKNLMEAGFKSNDKCWQMPINKEYSKQLKSNFADIANIGGEAGSITAACFLYQFIKEFKWAHLDVAGTAGIFTGNNKQSTGRPIPLLIKYLIDKCENKQ